MRKTALTLVIAALTAVAACKKTGENEFEVQTPAVGVQTDTIKTPDVDIVTDSAKITVPKVDVRKDTATVKVPKVQVKKP